jgi:hypothetical protein
METNQQVFTTIHSNGSGSVLPIEALFERLKTEVLDPVFEKYGDFQYVPHAGVRTEDGGFADGDPIYPNHPDAVTFFGNFLTYSHVFQIDTNDQELIERLSAAIAANKASAAYLAARKACGLKEAA